MPHARLSAKERTVTMKLSIKGVLLGAVADIVTTNILAIPIVMVVDVRLVHSAPGTAPSVAAFTQAMKGSPGLYLTALVLGSVASVFGGWVAARVARRSEVLNGAVSAVACMGFGVYAMIRYPQSAPLWQHIAFLVLSPVLGAVGGVIERRQPRRPVIEPAADSPNEAVVPAPLRGVQRSVYVVNRLLMIVVVLLFALFVLGGLLASAQHNPKAITGSIILCVLSLIAAVLLVAGGRSVRRGHASHWMFHVGAVAALAFPVAAIALGLAMLHKR